METEQKDAPKKLEILVVEDNPRYIEQARNCFRPAEEQGIARVSYAGNLAQAESLLETRVYNGIISDVFFPSGYESERDVIAKERLYGLLGGELRIRGDLKDDNAEVNEFPYGVVVAAKAAALGIPVILNTDSYHHGEKSQQVHEWVMKEKINMVDIDPSEDHKNYLTGRNYLIGDNGNKLKKWDIACLELAKKIAEKQGVDRMNLPMFQFAFNQEMRKIEEERMQKWRTKS